MKTLNLKYVFLTVIVTGILGCYPLRNFNIDDFTGYKHTIYYKNQEMARLTNIEYSLDNGKLVKEMTWRLVNQNNPDKIKNLIAYIHNKHKGWEIEIDLPISDTLVFENDTTR